MPDIQLKTQNIIIMYPSDKTKISKLISYPRYRAKLKNPKYLTTYIDYRIKYLTTYYFKLTKIFTV